MSLRTERKKSEVGKQLNTFEDNATDLKNQITSMFLTLASTKTFVDSKNFFSQAEKNEINTVIDELYLNLWTYVYDKTPANIKSQYPAA